MDQQQSQLRDPKFTAIDREEFERQDAKYDSMARPQVQPLDRQYCVLLRDDDVLGQWFPTSLTPETPFYLRIWIDTNAQWAKRFVLRTTIMHTSIPGQQYEENRYAAETPIVSNGNLHITCNSLKAEVEKPQPSANIRSVVSALTAFDAVYYERNLDKLYVLNMSGGQKLMTHLRLAKLKNITGRARIQDLIDALGQENLTFVFYSYRSLTSEILAYALAMNDEDDPSAIFKTTKNKLVLQDGQFQNAAFEGPQVTPMLEFRNFEEYCGQQCYAAKDQAQSNALDAETDFRGSKFECHFFTWPSAAGKELICIIHLNDDMLTTFRNDDTLDMSLDGQEFDHESAATATVRISPELTQPGEVLCFVSPRYDKASKTFEDLGHLKVKDASTLSTLEELRAFMDNNDAVSIELRPRESTVTLKRQINSLRYVYENKCYANLLTGYLDTDNHTPLFDKNDPAQTTAIEADCIADPSSRELFNWAQSHYDRLGLIAGPPGCGKSRSITCLVKWLLTVSDPTTLPVIFIATASNAQTTQLAADLAVALKDHPLAGFFGQIVRLYAQATEKKMFLTVYPDERPLRNDPNVKNPKDTIGEMMDEFYKLHKFRPHGVSDKRVTRPEFSLAKSMERYSAVHAHDSEAVRHLQAAWVEVESQWQESPSEEKTKLRTKTTTLFNNLRNEVLRKSHIIVGNITDAANFEKFSQHFRATILIVDEAGRIPDPDVVCGIARWKLEHIVLAGDPCQLEPVVTKPDSRFAQTLKLSFFERFMLLGVNPLYVYNQYRSAVGLNESVYKRYYGGVVNQHVSTNLENRPLARLAIKFNMDRFGKKNCGRLFIHVPGREMLVGTSYVNPHNVVAILEIIRAMRDSGAGDDDFFICTPYSASAACFLAAKYKLSKKHPNDRLWQGLYLEVDANSQKALKQPGIKVGTVDSVQGQGVRHLFIDLVRDGTNGWGFVSNKRRIITALTRASDSIHIIGNRSAFELGKKRSTALGELWSDLRGKRADFSPSGSLGVTAEDIVPEKLVDVLNEIDDELEANKPTHNWQFYSDDEEDSDADLDDEAYEYHHTMHLYDGKHHLLKGNMETKPQQDDSGPAESSEAAEASSSAPKRTKFVSPPLDYGK